MRKMFSLAEIDISAILSQMIIFQEGTSHFHPVGILLRYRVIEITPVFRNIRKSVSILVCKTEFVVFQRIID